MATQVAGLALKVLLSYLLIFGIGLPRLGAVGGALASAVVFWALLAAGWAPLARPPGAT
jgi:Na+-driven multidrug efflux pump